MENMILPEPGELLLPHGALHWAQFLVSIRRLNEVSGE
jgi:hypothetical protein